MSESLQVVRLTVVRSVDECYHVSCIVIDIAAVIQILQEVSNLYLCWCLCCCRDPARSSIVEVVNNRRLLCAHGKLCAEPLSEVAWDSNSSRSVM